jgi:ATP-binding cassette subfamily B (MDR/TAP) protein 7
VSDKEQRLTDWSIIKRLAVNIWPKGETAIKVRVVTAISLLIAGKVSFVIATMDD